MEISVRDVINIVGANIIDIRTLEKYNSNHIPGSINIPASFLISDYKQYLEKGKTYYLYCQKGITSLKVVQMLRALGYNCFSIIGGYEAYILEF